MAEDKKNQKNNEKNQTGAPPTRSLMLWIMAGIYLVYTGYRLCTNALAENSGIGFVLAGLAFFAIGSMLLFFGGKGMFQAERAKKEAEQKAAEEAAKLETAKEDEKESEN